MDGAIPDLPAGRAVDLPGRGRTWVYDSGADGAGRRQPASRRPPLVLLHGWTSTAALNWCRCFAPLAEHYRVVALDHRGHGRGIRSRRPFRLEDCADDVAALIDHLAIGPGHRRGLLDGRPGRPAALAAPSRPRQGAGAVRHGGPVRGPRRAQRAGRRPGLRHGPGAVRTAAEPAPAGLRRSSSATGRPSRGWPRGPSRSGSATTRPPWSRPASPSAASTRPTGSRTIDVPTSVVVTTLDATVEPARQWHLAQSIPGATAFPVAGTHRACVDQAELFVPALLAACRAVERPGWARRAGGQLAVARRPRRPAVGRWHRSPGRDRPSSEPGRRGPAWAVSDDPRRSMRCGSAWQLGCHAASPPARTGGRVADGRQDRWTRLKPGGQPLEQRPTTAAA